MAENSPSDTRERALQIKEAWGNIGADAIYGDMTLAEFEASIVALDEVEARIQNLQDQLTNARNERKTRRYTLWNLVKRVRAGAKARHGDDSDEYERFGGTRVSERKRPTRSQPPA